jgi:cytochrome c oxidase subunit 4
METTNASPTRTYPAKTYWKTGGILMLLLAVTWTVGYADLGWFNLVAALAIAIAKALLVALFFMHVKGSSGVLRIAAAAGLIWLLILFVLTLGDYFTRGLVPLNH